MSADRPPRDKIQAITEHMERDGANAAATGSFAFHFNRVALGEPGFLLESEIEPVETLPDAEHCGHFAESGKKALDRVVVIKLNGGLGTSMGLESAKSLLPVRNGLSFLDLIIRQILAIRNRTGAPIPLIFMNSAHTAEVTDRALAGFPELGHSDIPSAFLQNRVPKILASDLSVADHPREELNWCPPGHGDLYTAIAGCGLLGKLLDHDFEYAFVSNADNLGAVLDATLLGFMAENGHHFVMEAADRTAADRKGGHLCRLSNGRLGLRESAQCRSEDQSEFQDVTRHRFFNTNNLWLHLPTLARALEHSGGYLPLPTIVNRKTLDPRDPSSPPVLQLETAMGAAISLFEAAAAVRVPRRRFSPVKNTNDLLAVRSDAYELSEDSQVVLRAERSEPPLVLLDERYFKMIDAFEERFPDGPPSLRYCTSLRVDGDVVFGKAVTVEGEATIRAADKSVLLPDGANIRGEIKL